LKIFAQDVNVMLKEAQQQESAFRENEALFEMQGY